MKLQFLMFPALALAFAASTAQAAPDCFRMRDMHNHSVADAKTLYARVGMKDVYKFTMSNNCLAAKSRSDPLITRVDSGGGLVCRPLDLDLKVGGSTGPSACIIDQIVKLTPAEVAAIPKKLRP